MVKSFRFLFSFALVNLMAVFGCAAILIAGCYASGITYDASRHTIFENYYSMSPFMILLFLFLYAFSLCTSSLNLGLSFGARRRDFFWAIQGILLLYTAAGWALQLFLTALPSAANWAERDGWSLLVFYNGKFWTFPLLCVAFQVLGCLFGLLMVRHRLLAALLLVFVCLGMSVGTALMLMATDTRMAVVLTGDGFGWLFTTLPKLLTAALAVISAGGELLMWRAIRNYTVR